MAKTPEFINVLLASARRLTAAVSKKSPKKKTSAGSWQEEAWDLYDLVGEQRFLASTLSGRLSQARLFVGRVGPASDDPVPLEVGDPKNDLLDYIGGSPAGRAQILARYGVNQFVAGDSWLVGIPLGLLPEGLRPGDAPGFEPGDDLDITALDWRLLSVAEVSMTAEGDVKLLLGESTDEHLTTSPDSLFLIRVWRPHPRKAWEADAPTRASLPVLRELVGLTMHVSAQVDSRLAGAGLLIVPESAQRALRAARPPSPEVDQPDNDDVFTDALIEAMVTPISDRSNASAMVPLVVTVPDGATGLFEFLSFAKPLDAEARPLRDEAIRRLALGQDAPPELLLGTSGMNHWGAWLVREDVVTTHIEPPLALFCDAVTTQYLWPTLVAQGMSEAEAREYVIWYDVSHMVMRPNRAADAVLLHDRNAISDGTLRDATGFDESDAPPVIEALDPAVAAALDIIAKAPSLIADPGLPAIVSQIRLVLSGEPLPGLTPTAGDVDPNVNPDAEPPPEGGDAGEPVEPGDGDVSLPDTIDAPAPAVAASSSPPDRPVAVPSHDGLDGWPYGTHALARALPGGDDEP